MHFAKYISSLLLSGIILLANFGIPFLSCCQAMNVDSSTVQIEINEMKCCSADVELLCSNEGTNSCCCIKDFQFVQFYFDSLVSQSEEVPTYVEFVYASLTQHIQDKSSFLSFYRNYTLPPPKTVSQFLTIIQVYLI